MKLLVNEERLISSNEDKILLTNQRIHLKESIWGHSYSITIFLEDISSIEVKFKSNFILLLLTLAFIFLGIYRYLNGGQLSEVAMMGSFLLAVFFLIIWWLTRKSIVSISSNGGASLNFIVKGMSSEKIEDFIYSVSQAKNTRVNQLAKL